MNAAVFSAAAVLAGSAVGGVTSMLSTLFAQRTQRIAEQKSKLENLYGDFIEEASRRYTGAQTHDGPQLTGFVGIYAKINKMCFTSSPVVIASAERIIRAIVETYTGPNQDMTQLRAATLDRLRSLSNVCRAELRDLSFIHESERESAMLRDRAHSPHFTQRDSPLK